eukprot:450998_1
MCLGFFKFTKRKKKDTPGFKRLTSDCSIQIHADNEYFPASPITIGSPSTDDYSFLMTNSNNSSSNSSSNSPQLMRGYPKPLHFYNTQQQKHYLVITTSYHHKCNGCIYLYDISKNTYNSIPYPPDFKPEYHGHCINNHSGILYIFFGRHGVFATFDLYTNTWDVKCTNNSNNHNFSIINPYNIRNIWYPISYYIPAPINEIHIFGEGVDGNGNGSHIKFDQLANQFVELNVEKENVSAEYECDLQEVQLCYINHKKQLFILNGDSYSRKTWCLDFNEKENIKYKLLDIDKNSGDSVVLFDRFILIKRDDSIWCLDLKSNDIIWIESEFKLNGLLMEDANVNMIKVTDFYLHFINLVYPNHNILWFYYLLPYKIQCELNAIIAKGYVKNVYSKTMLMPKGVIDIIGKYVYLLL